MEHRDQVFSDAIAIKGLWIRSSIVAFGSIAISFFLFMAGENVGGASLLFAGVVLLIMHSKAILAFWPNSAAIAAHRRAVAAGKIATA